MELKDDQIEIIRLLQNQKEVIVTKEPYTPPERPKYVKRGVRGYRNYILQTGK